MRYGQQKHWGIDIPMTQENFPALQLCITNEDVAAGDTTITDPVSGMTWTHGTNSATVSVTGGGVGSPADIVMYGESTTQGATAADGSFASPGTKNVLLLAVGILGGTAAAAAAIGVGDQTTADAGGGVFDFTTTTFAMKMKANAAGGTADTSAKVGNASGTGHLDTAPFTTLTAAHGARALIHIPGSAAKAYEITTAQAYSDIAAGTTGNSVGAATAPDSRLLIGTGTSAIYGVAMFYFTSLPTGWEKDLQGMVDMAKTFGKFRLPPNWVGKT